MGVSTSECRPNAQHERLHGIYKTHQYNWTGEQVAYNIRHSKVTPILPYSKERTDQKKCFCEICYFYYEQINETTCCNHPICTECLAAVVESPPNQQVCPFCRAQQFRIRPNRSYHQLVNPTTIEVERAPDVIDIGNKNVPDEVLALLYQYPNTDVDIVMEMYSAQIPMEEIIAAIQG